MGATRHSSSSARAQTATPVWTGSQTCEADQNGDVCGPRGTCGTTSSGSVTCMCEEVDGVRYAKCLRARARRNAAAARAATASVLLPPRHAHAMRVSTATRAKCWCARTAARDTAPVVFPLLVCRNAPASSAMPARTAPSTRPWAPSSGQRALVAGSSLLASCLAPLPTACAPRVLDGWSGPSRLTANGSGHLRARGVPQISLRCIPQSACQQPRRAHGRMLPEVAACELE